MFVCWVSVFFLFFFLSRSCHPATLEGRDQPSDYLIRLELHWPLQATDRSVIKWLDKEAPTLTVVSPLLCRDLEESQAARPCCPVEWTPRDSKVINLNGRCHSIDQTSTGRVTYQWHCRSSVAFYWSNVKLFAENVALPNRIGTVTHFLLANQLTCASITTELWRKRIFISLKTSSFPIPQTFTILHRLTCRNSHEKTVHLIKTSQYYSTHAFTFLMMWAVQQKKKRTTHNYMVGLFYISQDTPTWGAQCSGWLRPEAWCRSDPR